jgi:DNA uptake protein ComE-like DNA-binding protein
MSEPPRPKVGEDQLLGLVAAVLTLALAACLVRDGLTKTSATEVVSTAVGPTPASPARLELNAAGAKELDAVPGLGPVLIDRILQARSERPFESLEDLSARVKGVGPKTLERLRPYLSASPTDEADPDDPPRPLD